MKLSRNLTLHEFTHAGSGKKFKLDCQHNLTPAQLDNARNLAKHGFQPIRDYINRHYKDNLTLSEIPIKVISGFRCEIVNRAVDGAKNSYHKKAMAMDIRCIVNKKLRNDLILEAIKIIELPFTELILEYGTYNNPLWIHYALDENNICHTVKRAQIVNGKDSIKIIPIW